MMRAGNAAARPNAVGSSGSAMPGATTARLVVCDFEIPIKLFMMPHTVPNSPTNGDVAPMVASTPMPSRIRRASARTISAKLDAARSLIPASLEIPADSRASRIAADNNDDNTLPLAPSALALVQVATARGIAEAEPHFAAPMTATASSARKLQQMSLEMVTCSYFGPVVNYSICDACIRHSQLLPDAE